MLPRLRKRLRIPARCWAAFAVVCGVLSCQASVFPPATATREYNALNAIVRLEDSAGRVTQWHYDRAGRAVALGLPNGQQQDNDYDPAGRLIGRTLYAPAGSANPGTEDPAGILAAFGWQHDAAGNVIAQIELWPGGGASGRVGLNPRLTEMSYDDAGHLTREKVTDPNAAATVTITDYTYDSAYNRATRTVTEDGAEQKSTAYTYNAANQLTGWTEQDGGGIVTRSATLGYDNRGNRASQTVTTTEAGGNTTGAAAQNTAYQWDHQNRLVGVTAPDGGQHAYRYDYRTRRIGRDEPGPGATAITHTGGLALAEYSVADLGLETSNSSTPAVEYRRGPDMGGGIGGLLYSLRGGQAKFNLSNGRGDIVAQSDAGAHLTWTASYEAFGKRPVETGTNLDRQRANTKEEDPTGLLHEHFRYRDLETGVWLSRDPAGFVDGPNLYAYVRQNPWSKFDPKGLSSAPLSALRKVVGKSGGDRAFQALQGALREALGKGQKHFRVHHVIHQKTWDSAKTGKWLDNLGVKRDALENVTILPTESGRKLLQGTDEAARSLHGGGHLKSYFQQMEKQVFDIQKRHMAGELDDAAAKSAIETLQQTTREGLENGTIRLQNKGEDLVNLGIMTAVPSTSALAEPIQNMQNMESFVKEGHEKMGLSSRWDNGFTRFVDGWVNPLTGAVDTIDMIESVATARQIQKITEQQTSEENSD